MSDNPNKNSQAIDAKIKEFIEKKMEVPPNLVAPAIFAGGPSWQKWVNDALTAAQEEKDRFLGRIPPKPELQPNPAISLFNHKWARATMNNKRELGPGDVKK